MTFVGGVSATRRNDATCAVQQNNQASQEVLNHPKKTVADARADRSAVQTQLREN